MINEFFSADQNIFWDAPLKLKVAAQRGLRVIHFVHTADQFSRSLSPANKKSTSLSQEAYFPDGSMTHWGAVLESAGFLGRAGIPSDELMRMIKMSCLAKWRGVKLEDIVLEFTKADRWGVTISENEKVAHYVTLREIKEGYTRLKGFMKKNLRETLGQKDETFQKFEEVWSLFKGRDNLDLTIGKVYPEVLSEIIGVKNVSIKTSIELFTQKKYLKTLFSLWLEDYDEMAEIYNKAVSSAGFSVLKIDPAKQKLPYYRLAKLKRTQRIRVSLTRSAALRNFDGLIIPKAVMLLLEILSQGPMLLPEGGSEYSKACSLMIPVLQKKYGLEFHPVFRVKVNALDNLKEVNQRFNLPRYLRPFFGEIVTGNQLASSWRNVLKEIDNEIKQHQGMLNQSLTWLEEKRYVTKASLEDYESIKKKLNSGTLLPIEKELLNAMLRAVQEEAYNQQVQWLISALHVKKSLEYWNNRPMYWWVHCIPEWENNILENATIEKEEMI